MHRFLIPLLLMAIAATPQQPDISGVLTPATQRPVIAVPDFRGSGDSQGVMKTFNATLADELENSGVVTLAPKNFYPVNTPQRPEDFKRADWYGPPVGANFVGFGYAAEKDGGLVLFGWLYNTSSADAAGASLFGKLYFGSLDDAGAKQAAREFAADILRQFGVKSLLGTKIYFVSNRTGSKEIWRMDYDGSSEERLTHFNSIAQMPAVSADGTKLAYSALVKRHEIPRYEIFMTAADTSGKLPFDTPAAPTNGWPDFTPDGQRLLFASSLTGYAQIYIANLDGSMRRQITTSKAIDVSPKVNPKNGSDILFISDRSGTPQLWHMNIDGGDMEMLTSGVGDVANPSWSPDGRTIAFSWTRGLEIGGFNIFVMDIADRKPIQLTKDSGVNENPWWAPDGLHIVYTSRRGKSTQIYTMLADGTDVRQITREGSNYQPVWANAVR